MGQTAFLPFFPSRSGGEGWCLPPTTPFCITGGASFWSKFSDGAFRTKECHLQPTTHLVWGGGGPSTPTRPCAQPRSGTWLHKNPQHPIGEVLFGPFLLRCLKTPAGYSLNFTQPHQQEGVDWNPPIDTRRLWGLKLFRRFVKKIEETAGYHPSRPPSLARIHPPTHPPHLTG